MDFSELKNQLNNNEIKKVYLFYGPEEYLKKHYLDSLEKTVLDKAINPMDKLLLEGVADINRIINSCETFPLTSKKKLVVVKNSGLFKAKKKTNTEDVKNKNKKIQEYINNLPEHVCLVFIEDKIDKRLRIFDAIKKNGIVVEFKYQKPLDLAKWTVKVFGKYGKKISFKDASLLIEYCEEGMNEVHNEIKKIASYLGERDEVNYLDIEKVCTKSVKSRVFDVADAVSINDTDKAMKLLNDMEVLREPVPKIFVMLTNHLRRVLQAKQFKDKGINSKDAALKMGLPPFVYNKLSGQAKRFSCDKLKNTIYESAEYDYLVKTGNIKDKIALEMVISRLSNK